MRRQHKIKKVLFTRQIMPYSQADIINSFGNNDIIIECPVIVDITIESYGWHIENKCNNIVNITGYYYEEQPPINGSIFIDLHNQLKQSQKV